MLAAMRIIIISGLSGSGKTIALNLFEDTAYYCVDNLPATLLPTLIDQLVRQGVGKAAVAIDSRSGDSIAALPQQPDVLRKAGHEVHFLFLDAKDETLLKRYSETRRRHPLASDSRTLVESISEERRRLARLADLGHRIDTSELAPNALREWIRQFITPNERQTLTLLFESFGFKLPPLKAIANCVDNTNDVKFVLNQLHVLFETNFDESKTFLDFSIPAHVAYREAATYALPVYRHSQAEYPMIKELCCLLLPQFKSLFEQPMKKEG